jgi:hypothetical protein
MQPNNFKKWYSGDTNLDSSQAMSIFEQSEGIKLPIAYKELVKFRDGGTLERYIFSYEKEGEIDENCIGFFLCWQEATLGEGETMQRGVNSPPEFFPKELIPFAPDGGGNYICFDYRNCKENPPIVFWHHEIEENEGIFHLADSFEEFLNSLKSEEEIEALKDQ